MLPRHLPRKELLPLRPVSGRFAPCAIPCVWCASLCRLWLGPLNPARSPCGHHLVERMVWTPKFSSPLIVLPRLCQLLWEQAGAGASAGMQPSLLARPAGQRACLPLQILCRGYSAQEVLSCCLYWKVLAYGPLVLVVALASPWQALQILWSVDWRFHWPCVRLPTGRLASGSVLAPVPFLLRVLLPSKYPRKTRFPTTLLPFLGFLPIRLAFFPLLDSHGLRASNLSVPVLLRVVSLVWLPPAHLSTGRPSLGLVFVPVCLRSSIRSSTSTPSTRSCFLHRSSTRSFPRLRWRRQQARLRAPPRGAVSRTLRIPWCLPATRHARTQAAEAT
mmetsp:Transcript_1123/g.7269  ORF Transcript_1123/g.7269 Transcript_1123/m.7269 type:complete len:332 (-) Transcript_1123:117-1112(-)